MDSTFNAKGEGIVAGNIQLNGIERNLATINDEVKITDLNQLCLEHIFMNLNLEDLVNVADANEYLKSATMVVYRRKSAGYLVIVTPGNVLHHSRDCFSGIEIRSDHILITKLKIIFQIFRCYGSMITKLELFYLERFYEEQFENYHHIMDYVNEFCAASLVSMRCNCAFGFEKK